MQRPLSMLRPVVARPFGAAVRVDFISLLLLAPLVWTLAHWVLPPLAPELATGAYWGMAVVATLGLAGGTVIRGAALLLAARSLHTEGVLTLYLFGPGFDTPAATRPRTEALLALLHLLVTALLAILFFVLFARGFGAAPPLAAIGVAFVLMLGHGALVVFYLLAGYPLDGGRLLRALLGRRRRDMRRATRWSAAWRYAAAMALLAGAVALLTVAHWLAALWMAALALLLASARPTSPTRTTTR